MDCVQKALRKLVEEKEKAESAAYKDSAPVLIAAW